MKQQQHLQLCMRACAPPSPGRLQGRAATLLLLGAAPWLAARLTV
jgi:hypothetical protein